MVREIEWTHNILIMERCHDEMQREFYIRMTAKFGWTKNVLALRIQDQTYEMTLPEPVRNQAKLAVRDGYTFDSVSG